MIILVQCIWIFGKKKNKGNLLNWMHMWCFRDLVNCEMTWMDLTLILSLGVLETMTCSGMH